MFNLLIAKSFFNLLFAPSGFNFASESENCFSRTLKQREDLKALDGFEFSGASEVLKYRLRNYSG
jgi:hypothetical protein